MNRVMTTRAGAFAALMLLPAALAAQETHRLRGSDVAVYNLAGRAEIVGGSGSDVVVEVVRGGSDAARLDIRAGGVGGGRQALRVVYPGNRVVYGELGRGSSTNLRVRSDGTFGDGGEGRGDRVEIVGSGRGLEAHADVRVRLPEGQRFSLYLATGEVTVRNVQGELLVDTGSGRVSADGVRGSLTVDTGSGSVRVRDVQGTLLVDTGSGGVELSRVRGSRVTVDTGSGSVEGSGVEAEHVAIDTGSGGVRLSGVASPDVLVDTGSGSVSLELLTDVQRLMVDTGSGSVTVRLPADVGANVVLDTGSGGIDVELPLQVTRAERTHLEGRLGDGGGQIVIDTGSGSIRVIGR